MTTSVRHSTAHHPPRHSLSGRQSTAHDLLPPLPPYRKPTPPVSPKTHDRLAEIYSKRTSEPLKTHNASAASYLTSAAGQINDHLRDRSARVERRRKKWEKGQRAEEQETEEEELERMQGVVGGMTEKLEKGMRECVDDRNGAERIEAGLDWLRKNAGVAMEKEYETQMSQRTQSQSQRQSGQGSRGDDEDESDEDEGPTPGPTPLGKERVELTGLSEMFEDKMEKEKIAYYSRSHKSRYAQDNDYIHFKKMVHDARYGDEGPPLPHADTWFTEQGIPALGVTETQGDNDDDIIVDRANISIRCPLTFQQFKEPYSSKKCPHTFEKNAIQTYIRNARVLRGEEKVVQCPVPGCEQMLGMNDLHEDLVIIRKIKRMQQAEAEADGAADSDSDVDVAPPRRSPLPKEEPEDQAPPRSSMVLDLGDPSDEEDEDEDEYV